MAATRVSTATDWRLLAVVGALVLALGGMVATTTDGVRLSQGQGTPTVQKTQSSPTHQDTGADNSRSSAPDRHAPAPPSISGTHGWALVALILFGLVGAALAVTLIACLRVVVLRQRRDAPRPTAAVPPPAVGEEIDMDDLHEVLRTRMAALDVGTPRNAIVAAWVELEDFAERHGWPHAVTDTPAEFVHRALGAYALSAADLERLAELYREARFSTHPVTEEHRDQARECLARLVGTGVAR